jgi:hypothetical protein
MFSTFTPIIRTRVRKITVGRKNSYFRGLSDFQKPVFKYWLEGALLLHLTGRFIQDTVDWNILIFF